MNFTKMQGTGNDFILVNGFEEKISEDNCSELAIKLCNRNFGIGADGLILALPSEKADIQMRIINSDGSEAEMCGNGIRCFSLFVNNENLILKNKFQVETLAGIISPEIISHSAKEALIKVNMGKPILDPALIPVKTNKTNIPLNLKVRINTTVYHFTPISMGNPHAVIFSKNINNAKVKEHGSIIEKHPFFPKKTNVEFIEVISKEEIKMRVWERGAAETLACGTGACASVVAGILKKMLNNSVLVHLLGGDLKIEWAGNTDSSVFMTGEAKEVFTGVLS